MIIIFYFFKCVLFCCCCPEMYCFEQKKVTRTIWHGSRCFVQGIWVCANEQTKFLIQISNSNGWVWVMYFFFFHLIISERYTHAPCAHIPNLYMDHNLCGTMHNGHRLLYMCFYGYGACLFRGRKVLHRLHMSIERNGIPENTTTTKREKKRYTKK